MYEQHTHGAALRIQSSSARALLDALLVHNAPMSPADHDSRTSFHALKTPRKSAALEVATGNAANGRVSASAADNDNDTYASGAHAGASPLDATNWLSFTTLWWVQPLLARGYNAPLQETDVWALPAADQSIALQTRFDAAWQREQARARRRGTSTPRFGNALWRATSSTMALATALHVLSALLTTCQPLLIKALLQFLQDEPNTLGIRSGYALALMLGAASLAGAVAINAGMFLTARAGCNARLIVVGSVYRKLLRLSATARRALTAGDVVTLASVDSERLLEAYCIGLWSVVAPLVLAIVCVLIGVQLGAAVGLTGAATVALIVYVALATSQRVGAYRRDIASVSAERVQITHEVLQGIRTVKLYGWEPALGDAIHRVRTHEVALLRRYSYVRLANAVLMLLAPSVLTAVCFAVYVARGHDLDVATAFVVLALANACKMPFTIFANATAAVAEASASTHRIAHFLIADEVDDGDGGDARPSDQQRASRVVNPDTRSHSDSTANRADGTAPPVAIVHGDFQWLQDAAAPALSDICMTLTPGSLTVVVGAVGSGKTSLVHAVLGEMVQTAGSRFVRADAIVAYASQQPWLQHATLRANIVFGARFDAAHYARVVAACQLAPDFAALEHGDCTEVGERGITLSGGQKARVGLARALYCASDVLVLDDPLSALDVHVANAVFTDGLVGLARGSTRLLVLNAHYHLLQHADRVLVLADGRIVGDGPLHELRGAFPFLAHSPRSAGAGASATGQSGDVESLLDDAFATTAAGTDGSNSRSNTPTLTPIAMATEAEVAGASSTTAAAATLSRSPTASTTPLSPPKKLVADEDRAIGSVSWRTYIQYLDCSGASGYTVALALVLLFSIAQLAVVAGDWFLSQWANGAFVSRLSQQTSLGVYAALVVLAAALVLARCAFYTEVCMRCSANLHATYMAKVLAAPVPTFFDVTPVGRVLNRFARDLDQVDTPLPFFSLLLLLYLFQIAAALVVCAATNAYVLALYVPLGAVFVVVTRVYQASARELKRLDGVTRSPFVHLVTETLGGLETIRAYGRTSQFATQCAQLLDHNGKFFFAFQAASRWFAIRTDWLVAGVITSVALLAVATRASLGAAAAGLGLTYAAQLTSSFQRMTTLGTMTETIMTCFERLAHYESLDAEGDSAVVQSTPRDWPRTGAVVFEHVAMRYRADLPLVLRNVSFTVASGAKVGVCGRTGSGKSSLLGVLFRVVECASGRVLLDGVDIASVPLAQLRAQLTIIPQDPVLFRGSLRMNLDPFGDMSDAALFDALRNVHLLAAVTTWGLGLDFAVAERGENLSLGQRQLLCIARALLRDSRVVVMDEATANVDQASDRLIQQTVKERFGGGDKTVLCIAHRIETILDSDMILVLDGGEVREFDSPAALLQRDGGIFRSLVASSSAVGALDHNVD